THLLKILDLFIIQIITATSALLRCFVQLKDCLCVYVGEGCEGRERSEAAAPAPLKNKPRAGAAGAKVYPVASPTPLPCSAWQRGHPTIVNRIIYLEVI
ncbi:MAG: hypothetical protein NZM35_05520, partial [Chitinophagales bacterium]|nr:hypothetical protein [Chitinophagales bacterium]